MTHRPLPLDIPDDDPFKHDALGRKPLVDFLASLIARIDGPFVMALDAPWGTGKTTLVHMLKATLAANKTTCAYFNAWESDYMADPLVALFATIDSLPGAKKKTKKLKGIVTAVARRTVIGAVKAATLGAVDAEKELEAIAAEVAGGAASDVVDAFHKQKAQLDQLKSGLEAAIPEISGEGKPTLVIFVDEIDRCRPTYALEVLERIKHVFDLSRVVFVLSLDKAQLEASVRAVYGETFNATEYLRRFFDLEYAVPLPTSEQFTASLFGRLKLPELFHKRTYPQQQAEAAELRQYMAKLADTFRLSLRTQERAATRIRIILEDIKADHLLFPILAAYLVVLRSADPKFYATVVSGQFNHRSLFERFDQTSTGREFILGDYGQVLAAIAIAAIDDWDRRESVLKRLEAPDSLNPAAGDRGPYIPGEWRAAVHGHAKELCDRFQGRPSLAFLHGKIDLVANVRR